MSVGAERQTRQPAGDNEEALATGQRGTISKGCPRGPWPLAAYQKRRSGAGSSGGSTPSEHLARRNQMAYSGGLE